jgi:hypothetical protein
MLWPDETCAFDVVVAVHVVVELDSLTNHTRVTRRSTRKVKIAFTTDDYHCRQQVHSLEKLHSLVASAYTARDAEFDATQTPPKCAFQT